MRCVTLSVWIAMMTACGTVEGSEAGLEYTPCDVLSETTVTEGASSVYGLAPVDEVLADLTGSFDLSLDRIDGGAPGPYPGTLTVSLGAGDIVAQERAMPSDPARLPPDEDCGPVYQVPFLTALDLDGDLLSVAMEQRLEVRDTPRARLAEAARRCSPMGFCPHLNPCSAVLAVRTNRHASVGARCARSAKRAPGSRPHGAEVVS